MIEIDGKNYVRIGDKLAEVDHIDSRGKPVIKAVGEEIPREDGGQDVIIHVPCLRIGCKTAQDGR